MYLVTILNVMQRYSTHLATVQMNGLSGLDISTSYEEIQDIQLDFQLAVNDLVTSFFDH